VQPDVQFREHALGFGSAPIYLLLGKRSALLPLLPRIEAALAASATIDEACASLASQASSNRRWFVLAATNASLVAVIGLFTWLLTSTGSFEASAPTPPSQPVLATAVEPPAASPAARTKASDNMPTPAATPMPASMPASEPMASAAAAASAPPPPPPPPATLQLADAQPVPARAPPPARPPASASSAAAAIATAASPSVPATGAKAVKTTAASAAAAPSAASPAPAATEFRFALQVGAFANEENARKAQAKLQAAGFKAYLEDLETSQGKRIRVRVGPFATRAEAEKAAPQVKALDLPALLVKS